MLSKKKKVFILCGMVSLLVLVVCLNIFLNINDKPNNVNAGASSGNFFIDSRADRQTTRDQMLLTLEAVIANESTSADAKTAAEKSKLELVKNMDIERIIETQIKALGFEDVFVTCSSEKVNVIIKTDKLTSVESAQILTIVKGESGKLTKNVAITPV